MRILNTSIAQTREPLRSSQNQPLQETNDFATLQFASLNGRFLTQVEFQANLNFPNAMSRLLPSLKRIQFATP